MGPSAIDNERTDIAISNVVCRGYKSEILKRILQPVFIYCVGELVLARRFHSLHQDVFDLRSRREQVPPIEMVSKTVLDVSVSPTVRACITTPLFPEGDKVTRQGQRPWKPSLSHSILKGSQ